MENAENYTALFCQEAGDILLEVEATVLALEENPADKSAIDKLFRMAHTIKGSSDMMGYENIKIPTHHVETLLGELRNGKISATHEMADIILEWRDRISVLVEAIKNNAPVEDDGGGQVIITKIGEMLAANNVVVEVRSVPAAAPADDMSAREEDLPAPDIPREQNGAQKPKAVSSQKDDIKVSADKLDRLINLVGELVITRAQLTQITAGLSAPHLSESVESIDRLTGELRDIALNIRMMPIGPTFNRFKRMVRDLSASLGKQVELVTLGKEAELDKTVIDRLYEPLIHLVRNSIDHGIEMPDVRERNGKPPQGTITIGAEHVGGSVIISIQDDGKGLDPEMIRAHAEKKGLVSSDAKMDEEDIFGLIFLPGFSTAEKVTDLSGRGVGMDVVRHEIEALGGNVKISSRKGRGMTISLILPLTLAIIDGLQVKVNESIFIISMKDVRECLELTSGSFAFKRHNIMSIRDKLVPCVRLRSFMNIADGGSGADRKEEAVVVNAGKTAVALIVDRVIGDYQTVIKPLGRMYKSIDFVSGSTIMGDGTVALILDMEGLCRHIESTQHISAEEVVRGKSC
jgi:two-component system chemotaxis sensor kinase CheA